MTVGPRVTLSNGCTVAADVLAWWFQLEARGARLRLVTLRDGRQYAVPTVRLAAADQARYVESASELAEITDHFAKQKGQH